jgi:hypothetical protein
MLLDKFLPFYQYDERQAIVVKASPERTFRAIQEVTLAEMPIVGFLLSLRTLPAHLIGRG